jgi:hypothetical protein
MISIYTLLVLIDLDFCIRSDDPLYPYGSGVQGTESQGRGNHHPGHQNVTPVGDEAPKPQPRTRGRKRKFVWKITGYTECTKTCGGGRFSVSVSLLYLYGCVYFIFSKHTEHRTLKSHSFLSHINVMTFYVSLIQGGAVFHMGKMFLHAGSTEVAGSWRGW